jgi:orotate phosphoribosyltransferase
MDVMHELEQAGAVLHGQHFVYKSGKHGSGYINMDPIFPDVGLVSSMCWLLVKPFTSRFDTIAGAATGGVVISFASALQTRGRRSPAELVSRSGSLASAFSLSRICLPPADRSGRSASRSKVSVATSSA